MLTEDGGKMVLDGDPPIPFDPLSAGVFASYDAANPDLVDVATNETFAPAAVNITNDTITLADTGWVVPGSHSDASRVWFSSTGTLPAPLLVNTPYYISGVAGVYSVWPTNTGNDYQNIPGGLAIENKMPAQNLYNQVNKVDLITQGSGTHTCYSMGLIQHPLDDSGNGYYAESTNGTASKHSFIEIGTDAEGYKYFDSTRPAMDMDTGTYNKYGKSFEQAGSSTAARTETMGARCTGFTAVANLRITENRAYWKITCTNTSISGTTFTYTSHGGKNGYRVKFQASSGTIPVEFDPGTFYYIHPISGGNTFSIHPTYSDAIAVTNAITPTAISGNRFIIYSDQQVGDQNRWGFWQEWYVPTTPETNLLSARISLALTTSQMEASNEWFVSGANNYFFGGNCCRFNKDSIMDARRRYSSSMQ